MEQEAAAMGAEAASDAANGNSGNKVSPWWGVVAVVVGAMAPLTTAVHGWIAKDKELELAGSQQQHNIRLAYLDRAIDPAKNPLYREQVLRFLVETSKKSDPIWSWANGALQRTNDELASTKQDLDAANAQLKQLGTQFASLSDQLERAQHDNQKMLELRRALAKLNSQIASTQANAAYLSSRIKPVPLPYTMQHPDYIMHAVRGDECEPSSIHATEGGDPLDCISSVVEHDLVSASIAGRQLHWSAHRKHGAGVVACQCELIDWDKRAAAD